MIGLTAKQLATLRFIAGYIEAKGRAPSVAEIRAGANTRGHQRTFDLLNALQERGHITRIQGKARSIEVLRPVTIPRSPEGAPLYFVEVR
jgi:SOS-response transcriptional repressor LexA